MQSEEEKMRTLTRTAVYSAAAVFLSFLFCLMPDTVTDSVSSSLYVCASRVIPSVFPFTVISSFFIKSGGAERTDALFARPFYRLFGLPSGASALFCSMFFGFPLGAMCVGSLYSSGRLDSREASRLLTFSACASPVYPVFAVGKGMFGSVGAGVLIFAAGAAVSVLIGILLNLIRPIRRAPAQSLPLTVTKMRLPEAVTASVADASRIILNVCGAVTFFSLLGRVISELLFGLTESARLSLFVCAAFEFASGCAVCAEAYANGVIGLTEALALSAFAIGFSGLSVICQNASVLPSDKISLTPHIIAKAVTGALSGAALCLLSPLFRTDVNVSVTFPHQSFSAITLLPSGVILLVFILILIKNQKKA